MLKIYNTMTHQKETFQPLHQGEVHMYVCGPTVYNYIHIGNARSTVAFDVVRRYLEFRGYKVTYISNFTDVDDKIIKRSNEEGLTASEVADKYIAAYYADTDALGVKRATVNPRVVDNMQEIIDFVSALVEKGYAYALDGDVYYRVRRFEKYGALSDQSLADLREGASERVAIDSQMKKEDSADFALWKAAKPGEPSWESPWGKGRPGWHIECSVMSTKYLGDTFDIHGGGQDLIFPHHENEIAQSEAKTGHKFARYWMHNGFVTMGDDGEKMSKSLGNFVLVHDLIQEVDPAIVRFFLAGAQYRSPLKFSEANLDDAKNNLERLTNAYRSLTYRLEDAATQAEDDQKQFQQIETAKEKFIHAMDDDFNVPNGLTVLYELMGQMNRYTERHTVSQPVLEAYRDLYVTLAGIFGVSFAQEGLLDEDIQRLIDERTAARQAKDFATSDAIRDQLKEQGILLDDTPQGTRWKRLS
ncbi:MAG: cysteine--tRNA ligase [Aerococcus sp.]|nr:cysteine--tRNA ligase [Aerococcus sp.]